MRLINSITFKYFIMTTLSKITGAILAIAVILVLSSCGGDNECFECAAYTDASGAEVAAAEFCEDDFGSGILFDTAIAAQNLVTTCTKK